MKSSNWRKHIHAALAILLIDFAATGWQFSQAGSSQLYVDPGIPPFRSEILYWSVSRLSIWNPSALGSQWPYPTELPYDLFVGGLAWSGFPAQWVPSLIVFLCVFTSGMGMYLYCRRLICHLEQAAPNSHAGLFALAAGVAYMLGPVLFNEVMASHLLYVVGYALAPLIVLNFEVALDGTKFLRPAAICGLLLSATAIQIQFPPMIFTILCLRLVFRGRESRARIRGIATLAVSVSVVVLTNLYAIFAFLTTSGTSVPNPAVVRAQMILTSLPPADAFRLDQYVFPFYTTGGDVLGPAWLLISALVSIVPWLALLGPYRRSGSVLCYAILGLATAAIVSLPIWGQATLLPLLSALPFAALYLEIYSLTFILAFSSAVLMSFCLLTVSGWLGVARGYSHEKRRSVRPVPATWGRRRLFRAIASTTDRQLTQIVVTLFVALICIGAAAFFGQWMGAQSRPYDFSSYQTGYKSAVSNGTYYNVLFLPPDSIVKFSGDWEQWGRNPILLSSPKPALDTESSTGGLSLTIYLRSVITGSPNTTAWAKVMALAGIKYVVLLKGVETALPFDSSTIQSLLLASSSFSPEPASLNTQAVVFQNLLFEGMTYSPTLVAVNPNPASVFQQYGTQADLLTPEASETVLSAVGPSAIPLLINSTSSLVIDSFLPSSDSLALVQSPSVGGDPFTGWATYQSSWWDAIPLSPTLSDPVYAESNSNMSVEFNAHDPGEYILSMSVTLDPLTYPPATGLGFSISVGSQSLGEWSTNNFPPWTTQSLLVPLTLNSGTVELTVHSDSSQQLLALNQAYLASRVAWQSAVAAANSYVANASGGALNLSYFSAKTHQVNMSGFILGNGPGEIQTSPNSFSYNFTVNKSQDYSDISQTLVFPSALNWSNYTTLSFSLQPDITEGNYNFQFNILDSSPIPVLTQYLRAFTITNSATMVSINLGGIPRSDIQKIYFQTGFYYPEYANGERVSMTVSNLSLSRQYSVFETSRTVLPLSQLITTSTSPSLLSVQGWNGTRPRLLVVANDYASAWELRTTTQPVYGLAHLLSDGTFNSWLVPVGAPSELLVYYSLQSTYSELIDASALSAVLVVTLMVVGPRRFVVLGRFMKRRAYDSPL
jgi:hypothetical protein